MKAIIISLTTLVSDKVYLLQNGDTRSVPKVIFLEAPEFSG